MDSTRNIKKSRRKKRQRIQAWLLLLFLSVFFTSTVGWVAHQLDRWVHTEPAASDEDVHAADFHVPAPELITAIDDVEMKASPEVDSEVLARLSKGTRLELIAASSGWLRVHAGEHGSGWVTGETVESVSTNMRVADGLWQVGVHGSSMSGRRQPVLTVGRTRPGVLRLIWEGNGQVGSVVPLREHNALAIPFGRVDESVDELEQEIVRPDNVSWHLPIGVGGIRYVTVRDNGVWIQGDVLPGYRVIEIKQNRVELELIPEVTHVEQITEQGRSGLRLAFRGESIPKLERIDEKDVRLTLPGARWAASGNEHTDTSMDHLPPLPSGWTWNEDAGGATMTFPHRGRTVVKHKPGEVTVEILNSDLRGKRIAIDPGHGGDDGGAISLAGIEERELNLEVSRNLKELLEHRGVDVILLRHDEGWVAKEEELSMAATPSGRIALDLEARVRRANEAGVDLFISIHHNGGLASYNGVETFYSSENLNASASFDYAHALQKELTAISELQDRGTHEFSYYVLRSVQAPAALVELGFITHASDWSKLGDPSFQRLEAEALLRGIEAFFNP